MPYKSSPADLARDWNEILLPSTRDLLVPADCRYCPQFNSAFVRCGVFRTFIAVDCPWLAQKRREDSAKTC